MIRKSNFANDKCARECSHFKWLEYFSETPFNLLANQKIKASRSVKFCANMCDNSLEKVKKNGNFQVNMILKTFVWSQNNLQKSKCLFFLSDWIDYCLIFFFYLTTCCICSFTFFCLIQFCLFAGLVRGDIVLLFQWRSDCAGEAKISNIVLQ